MTIDINTATIKNPLTGNIVKVKYALSLPHDHPAYLLARQKFPEHVPQEEPEVANTRRKDQLKSMARDAITATQRGMWTGTSVDDLEQFGQNYLNGVNPVDIVADYLGLLEVHSPAEIASIESTTNDTPSKAILNFSIKLRDGSTVTRTIHHNKGSGKNVIYHNWFSLEDRAFGRGIAKKMLRLSIDIADKINADTIEFTAGLQSGGYVWAKHGAQVDSLDRYNIASMMHNDLNSPGRAIERHNRKGLRNINEAKDRYVRLKELVKRGSVDRQTAREVLVRIHALYMSGKALKQVADNAATFIQENPDSANALKSLIFNQLNGTVDGNLLYIISRHPLGKFLLLDTSWDGYFDLTRGSLGRSQLEDSLK